MHTSPKPSDFIRSFLELVPPGLTEDYTPDNIIRHHYSKLHDGLSELRDAGCWDTIMQLRERLRRYYELGGEYEAGIEAGKIFLKASEHLQDTMEQAWIHTKDIGWLEALRHRFSEAQTHFALGLRLFEKMVQQSPKQAAVGRFFALRYLGVAHQRIKPGTPASLRQAEAFFTQAEEVISDVPAKRAPLLKARICQNIGNVRFDQRRFAEAEKIYRSSLRRFQVAGDSEHVSIALINVGRACLRQVAAHDRDLVNYHERLRFENLLAESEVFLRRGLEVAMEVGWLEGQARARQWISELFEERCEPTRSLEAAKESLALYQRVGSEGNVQRLAERVDRLHLEVSRQPQFDVFVVMAMDPRNAFAEVFRQTVDEASSHHGLHAARSDDLAGAGRISQRIQKAIAAARLVICDLTLERPNVYYELGLTHALKKRVILTARAGTTIHFDLHDFDILLYRGKSDLRRALGARIRAITNKSTACGN